MAACVFPYNPVLVSMAYANEKLTLEFIKPKGTQRRTYEGVPSHVAYALFYKRTGSDVVGYFSRYIKKQYKVLEVTTC